MALAARQGWHCYVIYKDGKPAAAAAMFRQGTGAWLGIDVTLPPYRGLGMQAALIQKRLSDLGPGRAMAETGLPAATHQAADASYRNYRRGGFIEAYPSINFAASR